MGARAVKRVVLVVVASLIAASAFAYNVQAGYYARIDFTGLKTYAWLPGLAAPDPQTQQLVLEQVEQRMRKKGWTRVEGPADLYLRSDVIDTMSTVVGALRLDLIDRTGETLVWRGLVSGVRSTDRKLNHKRIKSAIKDMFRDFPKPIG